MENRLCLVASIIERDAIRYTPAGIPVITARLQHRSEQTEAETARIVEFEVPAKAIGSIAGRLEKLEPGQIQRFTGFMAAKSQKSKTLVFHITNITSITDQE
ncbi:primosomal replication protein N [Oxalobacter sp. OttesenSCG-928-P03]|nr:primosomal replication protein N [Oxalobacter sp. OttesenSCG-928-P03]